jgi:hypothetical protein
MALESGTGACRDRLQFTDDYVAALRAEGEIGQSGTGERANIRGKANWTADR